MNCAAVDFPLDGAAVQQGLELACENKSVRRCGIIKRLHSDAVAGDQQRIASGIPQCESEYSIELAERAVAVLQVQVEDDFRVGSVAEAVSIGLQSDAEFAEIENFTVEDDADRIAGVPHRLAAARGDVDD